MSAITVLEPTIGESRSIVRQLDNGRWLTYTEIPDDNFALRYNVQLDGHSIGLLALWFIEPFTQEKAWIASAGDNYWSPTFTSHYEAVQFLIPPMPSC